MRQNTNPDSLYVGDFKGMATSGGTYAASPEYLQSLTNATVTKDGTLKPRTGSKVLVKYVDPSGQLYETFRFSFAGQQWLLQRFSADFILNLVQNFDTGEPYNIAVHSTKFGVLRAASASERATYAVKTDGNYCHVLIATKSTQMIAIVLSKRDALITAVGTNTATATIGQWYTSSSSVSITNTKVIINGELDTTLTGVSVSGTSNVINYTWTSTLPAGVAVGNKLTTVSCFWCRYVDANYYQGNMLFNTGLRRNSVPLDVNVPVPDTLSTNYIYNEPLQDLSVESYFVYTNTNVNATRNTRVTNNQPTTATTWDFSDGSYRNTGSQLTNRTPSYIAFGALESGNINSRVGIVRNRAVLLSDFEYADISNLGAYVDKKGFGLINWYNSSMTPISTGSPTYFGFGANLSTPPGVNQDSVVELLTTFVAAGAASNNTIVDISTDSDRHTIVDGACIPLYGYNLICKTRSFVFPNIVKFVGNRLVLCGNGNRILVSDNSWNFRGFTYTNVQVSSFEFSENSPYMVRVDQTGANVVAFESVNGVMFVFTEVGIYRITGKSRTEAPTATVTTISKLSNQIVANSFCTIVADNSVYFSNRNGLFSISYIPDQFDSSISELSLPVNDLFSQLPQAVSYSIIMDSILVQFKTGNKLIRYSLLTKTFSYVHVAVPAQLFLFPSHDGYLFTNNSNVFLAVWSNTVATDLFNLDLIANPVNIAANEATIALTPTLAPVLVSPPELMQQYAGTGVVLPAYGGTARAVGSAAIVTENAISPNPRPIFSSAVTKSIYTDKTTRGLRFRDVSCYLKGTGTFNVAVVGENSRTSVGGVSRHSISVASDGTYQVRGSKQKNHNGFPNGDTVVVELSDFGISEAYALAIGFTQGAEVVGFCFNTSAKTLGRLQ